MKLKELLDLNFVVSATSYRQNPGKHQVLMNYSRFKQREDIRYKMSDILQVVDKVDWERLERLLRRTPCGTPDELKEVQKVSELIILIKGEK